MHFLNDGDGLFANYTREKGTTETMAYVLKDHLGSIHCLVDKAGAKTEELSFDAWGRRRNPTNWQPLTQTGNYQTLLGFTGHERIDIAALVNMNGRVYDTGVGRFLSPDPFMQVTDYFRDRNGISQSAVILPKLVHEFIFSKIIFFLLLEKGILISFAMPILVSMMSSKRTIAEHPMLLNTIEFSM